MNQTTKKQHYIWRKYLAPWTSNHSVTGRIICLRANKIFSTSLMNIAHENYFYETKKLSELEKEIIYEMIIKRVKGVQKTINQNWLSLYCVPFDLADNYFMNDKINQSSIKETQDFKDWIIEYIEKFHGLVETMGIPYISSLRENDLSFWKNEKDRDAFSYFLANQYFRTKNMRDKMIRVFESLKTQMGDASDIHPGNMWIPLSLIFATNLGVYISHDLSAVLLQTKDGYFMVGDQPILNTYATFDLEIAPQDLELYYPITPSSALLLTKNPKYKNESIVLIESEEVEAYNRLEQEAASEIIFAKERTQLELLIENAI